METNIQLFKRKQNRNKAKMMSADNVVVTRRPSEVS